MFDNLKNFIKEKSDEKAIEEYEKSIENSDVLNEFDNDFYDWSKLSATCKGPGLWYYC
ncbi:MAG: hypothetical protein IJY61_08595 [Candidatus Gastranaerophilales bacterium]|nr:hypothetical protein [Candidatus Gastranaerophilales bacterium]